MMQAPLDNSSPGGASLVMGASAQLHVVNLQRTFDGKLGIGIVADGHGREFVIASIEEGTPAASSNLQVMDRLVSLNGDLLGLQPGQHLGELLARVPKDQAVQLGIIRTVHGRPSASEQAAADLDGASRETPLLECELTGMQLYSQGRLAEAEPLLASALRTRRVSLGDRRGRSGVEFF
mmetsp:Transcript_10681/g.22703  ORF Transcript_10681/g.22703 Transcript_10681/m.22703 type:complete len:179 (-) Transcript_10681:1047-1583(-)